MLEVMVMVRFANTLFVGHHETLTFNFITQAENKCTG
jgi:hypothetical protein